MTRHMTNTFHPGRPLFVKIGGLQASGKVWVAGERFNWEALGVPMNIIQTLFNQDFLHHNEELEEVVARHIKVGDGLEELNLDQLHTLVAKINTTVKEKSSDAAKFTARSCKKSNIKDKQIGLIRAWRLNYGDLE